MPIVSWVLGGGLPARQAARMAAFPGREGGGTLSAEVKSDVKLNHDRHSMLFPHIEIERVSGAVLI